MTTRAARPGRLSPSRPSRRGWPLALPAAPRPAVAAFVAVIAALAIPGCARQSAVPFRVDNVRAHLDRLTNAGPRPTGSAANAAARAYLVDQLRLYGFDVRTQTVDATHPTYSRTMRVSNIVATRPGSRQDALALVAHYDSVAIAPGAMDDGIGTAVALESARLLATAPALRHTLIVLITDGEESGLMGAIGAMGDAELRSRLKGYINLESTGSTGPAILFESGPNNEALIRAWANAAPRPHGASYALEIYKRLPNDTDFSILKAAGIPGLNMAPVGNSHAYHTSRDTADRVSADTLLHMGETAVTTLRAMDALDRQSADRDVRFASVGERTVIVLADWQGRLLAILALGLGLFAWIRIVRHLAAGDAIRFVATALWGVLSVIAAAGAMVGASWLLGASSAVHHPWYASPMRAGALIAVSGILGPWLLTRLALVVPERVRYAREPASIWGVTLPIWCVITAVFEIKAPLASPLWALSLALAGAALAVVPPGRTAWMRAASLLVLAVTLAAVPRRRPDALRVPGGGARPAVDRHPGLGAARVHRVRRGDDRAAGGGRADRPRRGPSRARLDGRPPALGLRRDARSRVHGAGLHRRSTGAALGGLRERPADRPGLVGSRRQRARPRPRQQLRPGGPLAAGRSRHADPGLRDRRRRVRGVQVPAFGRVDAATGAGHRAHRACRRFSRPDRLRGRRRAAARGARRDAAPPHRDRAGARDAGRRIVPRGRGARRISRSRPKA